MWAKDEEINNDTKAVEYLLQGKLEETGLGKLVNFLHFGLTSTDIDNTAFALSVKAFVDEVYVPRVRGLIDVLKTMAGEHKGLVMLGRTHGQLAVPTTAGKELANFASRLEEQRKRLENVSLGSKMTGAVGSDNARVAAFPEIDWPQFTTRFLKELGLASYPMTTQVEPYEHKVEFIQAVKRMYQSGGVGARRRYLALPGLRLPFSA